MFSFVLISPLLYSLFSLTYVRMSVVIKASSSSATELCRAFKSMGDYAALGLIPVGWSLLVLLYFNGI